MNYAVASSGDVMVAFGTQITITCNNGYERQDGQGSVSVTTCLREPFSGPAFSAVPSAQTCVAVSCGPYCRYCPTLSWPSDSDSFGPCCKQPPAQLSSGFKPELGAVQGSTQTARFNDSATVVCAPGYDIVPGSGSTRPLCVVRDDCQRLSTGWNKAECAVYRGVFQPGATCAAPAEPVTFLVTGQLSSPCDATSSVCIPDGLNMSVSLSTPTPGATIYYRVLGDGPAPGTVPSPVTPSTDLVPSSAAPGAMEYKAPIMLVAQRVGCDAMPVAARIRAVAVLSGQPNSPDLELPPLFKVTASSGNWPSTVSTCATGVPQPIYHCTNPSVTTKEDCLYYGRFYPNEYQWVPLRPKEAFGGCLAYRFVAFAPTALSSDDVDAVSLGGFTFTYRKEQLTITPEVYSDGVYPAAENPANLAMASSDTVVSKWLGMDNCPVYFDFGKPVVFDGYYLNTSNDCSARDPTRWNLLASSDAVSWIVVDDQTGAAVLQTSERSGASAPIEIDNVRQTPISSFFESVHVSESTTVPGAVNLLTMELFVAEVDPRIGTDVVVTGLFDFGVPPPPPGRPAGSVPLFGASVCIAGSCYSLLRQDAAASTDENLVTTVSTILLQCPLPSIAEDPCAASPRCLLFSFEVVNPAGPIPPSSPSVSLGGSLVVPAVKFEQTVGGAGGTAQLLDASIGSTSAVRGARAMVAVKVVFNFKPLAGTWLRVRGLLGARSPSRTDLPGRLRFEDSSAVPVPARWNQTEGSAEVSLPEDARKYCDGDGRCTHGKTFWLDLFLVNPTESRSAPVQVFVSAVACVTPTCALAAAGAPSGTLPAQGMPLAAVLAVPVVNMSSVLSGDLECAAGLDACSECGGDSTLCAGCDGVVNSGAVVDQCKRCGGTDACVGCDGVPYSNATRDVCGVCRGVSACITTPPMDNPAAPGAYPSVSAQVVVSGLGDVGSPYPGGALMLAPNMTKVKESVAQVVSIQTTSVSLVAVTAVTVQRRRVAAPSDDDSGAIAMRKLVAGLTGLGRCDVSRAAWSGCRLGSESTPAVLLDGGAAAAGEGEGEFELVEADRFGVDVPWPAGIRFAGSRRAAAALRLDLVLSFLSDEAAVAGGAALGFAITNGTLAFELRSRGLCAPTCTVVLVKPVNVTVLRGTSTVTPPPTASSDPSLIIIIAAVCGAVGLMLCMGLCACYKWRQAVERRDAMYEVKLADMVAAAERGREALEISL